MCKSSIAQAFTFIKEKVGMTTQQPFSLRHAAVLACLVLSSCLPGFAQSRMTVRRDVHRDVSAPLREMILHAPAPSLQKGEAEPVRRIPFPPGLTQLQEDSARQRTVAPLAPVGGASVEGLAGG